MNTDFDEIGFKNVIGRYWVSHQTCRHQMWSTLLLDDGVTQLSVAPIFQQILGGAEDGKLVWTGFSMKLHELLAEPFLEVTEFGFRSYCETCTPNPFIGMRGSYKLRPFILTIHLEPELHTEPIEVIDIINNQTRAIRPNHNKRN